MMRESIVRALSRLAENLGVTSIGSEWYIFGSADRNTVNAADIDLMILCLDAFQTDELRRAIDPDQFSIPIHLALLTFQEALEVDAVNVQQASKIYP